MVKINVHEAKTHFSKLLERVNNGEEVIIAKAGSPIARLVPIGEKPKKRVVGSAQGKVAIADNFDVPLPESILSAFER